MLLRAERSYKENRIFEMIKCRRLSSSSSFLQIYEDPKASAILGPSAVAMVRKEYSSIEEEIQSITSNLMKKIEIIETNLFLTKKKLKILKNKNCLLHADLQDMKERKGLLMSQFVFFSNERDQNVIIPQLRNKIEYSTKMIEEYSKNLQIYTKYEMLYENKLKKLKSNKFFLQNKLIKKMKLSDDKRGNLAITLFDKLKLK